MATSSKQVRLRWVPAVAILLISQTAWAQPGSLQQLGNQDSGGMPQCPMMNMGGGWMMTGMILTGLLTLAAIGALVALSIFLVRRSHANPPGGTPTGHQ